MITAVGVLAIASAFGRAQQQPPSQTPPPAAQQQRPDSTGSASVSERGSRGQVQIMREVFTYAGRGRRDPMVSLMSSADIRPLISEVEVISILYTGNATTSMAVLRHLTAQNVIYRVKVGDMLGRMTVARIEPREVFFTLDEFGFSRTERLAVKPDTTARTP
jgi:hypothetical protein